jgi:hypothetical protein
MPLLKPKMSNDGPLKVAIIGRFSGILSTTPFLNYCKLYHRVITKKIRSDVEKAKNALNSRGMQTTVYYISPLCFDAFADQFTDENNQSRYDYVVLGAEMRNMDDLLDLFQTVVNYFVDCGTKPKICFPRDSNETANSVLRWM